ncbi:FecR family protein [Dyadobacter luticola]|uniref:FecR family protein n=1 Tax=Dyadobacter luticola TaxID=1979387 RepID=A0A5R9KX03_9BACT|nr:FecR family protein [Dyadobacter luticola]TLV00639.1 FecR family protein [Dyadobacter luticola]
MNQYDFQKTLNKYLTGQHTPEEEEFILEYLKTNPLSEEAVFETEKDVIGKRIKRKLFASVFGKSLVMRLAPWMAAAASVLIVAGSWYFFTRKNNTETIAELDSNVSTGVFEIKNTSEKPQQVPLEDGSVVILKKNSSISVPEHFGRQHRLVYLHGEAFFQIKKDPSKPFIVSTGSLMTKVLGTSFSVKSYDESASVEVQVKTGRVSVYEGAVTKSANRNGVILTPNQKIVFDKKSKKMSLSIIENPLLIIPANETAHGFSFSDVPVKDVFSALEKSYGIDIVLENDTADSCLFTGDLNGLSMFQQLDLICKSANISYERRGTALFVEGAGCVN